MIGSIDNTSYRIGLLDKAQNKLNFQYGGQKIEYGSDDSVLYSRLTNFDDKMRTNKGIQDQINRVDVLNTTSDTVLASSKKILDTISSELIKANTATTTTEGLEAIAQNLVGLKQNLFDLANTSTEDQYVFSGSDSSVKAFIMDASGKVTYNGDDSLRKVAVSEGSYRDAGVNGLDAFYYTSDTALKNGTLSFKADDKILDQDGIEWKLNTPTNDTLTKTNWDGSTESIAVNAPVPPSTEYTATMPNIDGTRFEAKRSLFDMLDSAINSLKGLDDLGNPFAGTDAENYELRREGISQGVDDMKKVHDAIAIAHSDLGAKNKTFEVSMENLASKHSHLNRTRKELGDSDLTEVTIQLKALEISYAALYSTINRTFELSLTNFLR